MSRLSPISETEIVSDPSIPDSQVASILRQREKVRSSRRESSAAKARPWWKDLFCCDSDDVELVINIED